MKIYKERLKHAYAPLINMRNHFHKYLILYPYYVPDYKYDQVEPEELPSWYDPPIDNYKGWSSVQVGVYSYKIPNVFGDVFTNQNLAFSGVLFSGKGTESDPFTLNNSASQVDCIEFYFSNK